jgi:hypothetical protein
MGLSETVHKGRFWHLYEMFCGLCSVFEEEIRWSSEFRWRISNSGGRGCGATMCGSFGLLPLLICHFVLFWFGVICGAFFGVVLNGA